MSEPIKWAETSDKEKVRLIIEHVFHFYIMPDSVFVRGRLVMPRERLDGFHWPIAFWNSDGDCWQLKDVADDGCLFDPLRDLDDAMQIVEEINAGNFTLERVITPPIERQVSYARYSEKPCFYEAAFYLGENWTQTKQTYHHQADTPHEAICIAALRVRGIEVMI